MFFMLPSHIIKVDVRGVVTKMLVALYENQFVDMTGETSKEQWYSKMRTGFLLCPVCKNKVIPKCGSKNVWHFAHQSQVVCAGLHEAETNYHLLGKKSLFHWLKKKEKNLYLEHYLRDIAQRPDIYLGEDKKAIEFQCATLNVDMFASRINGYQSIGIESDWFFGMKRINKKRENLYSLQMTDLTAAKRDKTGKLSLNYFCPLQQQFLLLRNILPISQRKVLADGYTFSAKNLEMSMIFDTLNGKSYEYRNLLWNKQKKTWRMTAYKNVSPSIMYVKKVMYFNHRSITLFSPLAGMPSYNYYFFETSPFIWQSYLLFFIDKLSSIFTLNQLENECRRLLAKRIFLERKLPYIKGSYQSAIKGYLNFLESEQIIEQINDIHYKKKRPVPYPKTLDEAFEQDKIFSKKAVIFDFV
jgi:competence protein CoiA